MHKVSIFSLYFSVFSSIVYVKQEDLLQGHDFVCVVVTD